MAPLVDELVFHYTSDWPVQACSRAARFQWGPASERQNSGPALTLGHCVQFVLRLQCPVLTGGAGRGRAKLKDDRGWFQWVVFVFGTASSTAMDDRSGFPNELSNDISGLPH